MGSILVEKRWMWEGQAVRQHGQITLEREQSVQLLNWGIRFFLTAALTASGTPGDYAPFALGLVAAAGPGANGAAALIGAGVGAVLFLDFSAALPYLAICVLLLTASTAMQGTWAARQPWFSAATAVGMTLAVGGIYVISALSPVDHLTPCVAAAGLAGASAWYFRPLLHPEERGDWEAGALFLLAAFLLAAADVSLLGLSLGRVLLGTVLLYAACQRGPLSGATAGLGLGLVTDLCAGTGGGLFTATYGLMGLLAGRTNGRRRAALASLAAALAALLPATHALAETALAETAVSAGLFLLLPRRLFGGKRVQRKQLNKPESNRDKLRRRLNQAAEALRDLYDSCGRNTPAPTEENPAILFDRTAEKVCRHCALCSLCWQKEYAGTFNALNDATANLLDRGRALRKDFPEYFTSRCIHLQEFLTALDGELSAFLLRQQYRRQLEATRRSARGQYAQLSELLMATAVGLEVTSTSGSGPNCQVGAILRPKEGEVACGDTLTAFQGEDGTWNLLLSDGMGSGEAARKESALVCRLLQQFLEAGIAPEIAMKTLNGAMALRGAETGSFTTIDLCTFDPVLGTASFYKYGAAPSYLKKGGVVRRITGNSLPAGLRGAPAPPDKTAVRLEPGSFAVMISDGVADPNRDDWLQDLLAGWDGRDPQLLAADILSESMNRADLQDDRSVQILYYPPEERLV